MYLLRYAASNDYYSLDLEANGLDGNFLMAQGNVYLNFDFIYFTFGDSENHTVLAIVSDPTDGFLNLTDTTSSDDFKKWIKLLVAIAVILVVILVIVNVVLPVLRNFLDGFTNKKRSPRPPKRKKKKVKIPKIKGRRR